jgi:hypothetical protein
LSSDLVPRSNPHDIADKDCEYSHHAPFTSAKAVPAELLGIFAETGKRLAEKIRGCAENYSRNNNN